MLESAEYRIVAESLKVLAEKAEEEANAIDSGKPRRCGLKPFEIEIMMLQATMLNEGTINKGMVAELLGKSPRMVDKYIESGLIPHGMDEKYSHSQRWSRAMIEFIANKKAFIRKQVKKYGLF